MQSATSIESASPTDYQGYLEVRIGQSAPIRFDLNQVRTSIGRRPYNSLELPHPTVSGEHAVLLIERGVVKIRDLNSRNGTQVNGQPVREAELLHCDEITIGAYRLKLITQNRGSSLVDPFLPKLVQLVPVNAGDSSAVIDLPRPINSISVAKHQMAIVSRRRNGIFITHLEGLKPPLVNGESIGLNACQIEPGDLVELAGTVYRLQVQY